MLHNQDREKFIEEEQRLAYVVKTQFRLGVPAIFCLSIGGLLAANHFLGTHFEWAEILLLAFVGHFSLLDNFLQLRKVRNKLNQQ